VNTGAPWPGLVEAERRVRKMQAKLHRWAAADPGRRFDDLHNLVDDPAFLVVAWSRVQTNKGARTAGVDGVAPRAVGTGLGACWASCEMILRLAGWFPSGCGRRRSPRRRASCVVWGSPPPPIGSCKPG
jgi:RNA-directed DNA polymerase